MSMKSNKELWATAMRAALRVEFITNIKELSLYAKSLYQAMLWAKELSGETEEPEKRET